MSSTSLAENAKACTEEFDQILELFPDRSDDSSHPLYQKVLDRLSKSLLGVDKDKIQGLSRKMINHEYERFKSWKDISQHILDNKSDLAAFSTILSTGEFVKVMQEALIGIEGTINTEHVPYTDCRNPHEPNKATNSTPDSCRQESQRSVLR